MSKAKRRFQPGEQVVVSDAPAAQIYTIKSMHMHGVVELVYYTRDNKEVSAGVADVCLLDYPTIGQLCDQEHGHE